MVERVLITSPFEATWPEDSIPVLFLGEWCRLYARKEKWLNMDAEVVPYHWDDRQKYHNDYEYLKELHEKLLGALSNKLNEIHHTNHNPKYWRILIAPWLGYFVQMVFDRWSMLDKAVLQNHVSCSYVLGTSLNELIPNDMAEFQKLFVDDFWNEGIYHEVLKHFPDITIKKVEKKNDPVISDNRIQTSKSFLNKLKTSVKKAGRLFDLFVKPTDSFFISSYLPKKSLVKLQLQMGQIPKFWGMTDSPKIAALNNRPSFSLETLKPTNRFEQIVFEMIPEHIPRIYLEGYQALQVTISQLRWPAKPRLMFTANSDILDDVFKAWAAQKTEQGSQLVIAQHGGNFGTAAFGFVEDHQISVANKYISWGWDRSQSRVVKPFANLVVMDKKQSWDPQGNVLLVTMALPRYSYHLFAVPLSSQILNYFEDQYQFVETLPENIKENLLVRLFSQDFRLSQKQRWNDRLTDIKLDTGAFSMKELINKSRLFISTYNSTTFLESLSLNVPTIIFWNPNHWELKEEALPYFEALKKCGIFHETPQAAANKVAEVYDDVSGWWDQPYLQEVRAMFCERFSRNIPEPISELKRILLDESVN